MKNTFLRGLALLTSLCFAAGSLPGFPGVLQPAAATQTAEINTSDEVTTWWIDSYYIKSLKKKDGKLNIKADRIFYKEYDKTEEKTLSKKYIKKVKFTIYSMGKYKEKTTYKKLKNRVAKDRRAMLKFGSEGGTVQFLVKNEKIIEVRYLE